MKHRRGAALVLVLMTLGIFLIMAAMTLNIAYMQLVRTELRAATDAAARAGTEALARLDSSQAAIQAAIDIAAANRVAGVPLVLTANDIELGNAARANSGQWNFSAGATPISSVRVHADMVASLMMSGVTGRNSFNPQTTSTAAFTESEICLVVDRSHSMCFDHSGVEWSYPPDIPLIPDPVTQPPHATSSRWATLANAIDTFLSVVANTNTTQRVALVTWGSDITLDTYEGALTGRTFPAASWDVPLGLNYATVSTSIASRGNDVMLGGTNLSAGIDLGVLALTGENAHSYAHKTMIVMTDGKWNEGRSPVLAAQDAKTHSITIHTVTFLDGADQQDMIDVATVTGGRHYHASNAVALEQAFEEMARHLAVVLID